MVPQRIPSVVFRSADNVGAQGIEVYVGQTVYEGLSFINDDTFAPVAAKIAPPAIPVVVISGKSGFYFTDKFSKA